MPPKALKLKKKCSHSNRQDFRIIFERIGRIHAFFCTGNWLHQRMRVRFHEMKPSLSVWLENQTCFICWKKLAWESDWKLWGCFPYWENGCPEAEFHALNLFLVARYQRMTTITAQRLFLDKRWKTAVPFFFWKFSSLSCVLVYLSQAWCFHNGSHSIQKRSFPAFRWHVRFDLFLSKNLKFFKSVGPF